jgi:hypothetical protein
MKMDESILIRYIALYTLANVHLQLYGGEEKGTNTCVLARLVGRGVAMSMGTRRTRE